MSASLLLTQPCCLQRCCAKRTLCSWYNATLLNLVDDPAAPGSGARSAAASQACLACVCRASFYQLCPGRPRGHAPMNAPHLINCFACPLVSRASGLGGDADPGPQPGRQPQHLVLQRAGLQVRGPHPWVPPGRVETAVPMPVHACIAARTGFLAHLSSWCLACGNLAAVSAAAHVALTCRSVALPPCCCSAA